jgi:hypothetical protein
LPVANADTAKAARLAVFNARYAVKCACYTDAQASIEAWSAWSAINTANTTVSTAAWSVANALNRDASTYAISDAIWEALAPTVKLVQASAFDLLERMLPTVMIDLPDVQVERVRELVEA